MIDPGDNGAFFQCRTYFIGTKDEVEMTILANKELNLYSLYNW